MIVSPLVAPLLSDFLVSVSRLAGRPEVDHTITHWADRHHNQLAAAVSLDPQTVFDAINSALVQVGCFTGSAVAHADEAQYWAARHLGHVARNLLHTAVYEAAEELVGVVRPRWLDLDPVLDLVADNLSNAATLERSST